MKILGAGVEETGAEHTGVPSVKNSPLASFGPSVTFSGGIPCSGIAIVLQKSCAARSATCHADKHQLRSFVKGLWSGAAHLG